MPRSLSNPTTAYQPKNPAVKQKDRDPVAAGARDAAVNRAASHNYFLTDRFEAGVALRGTEVKSIREGKANKQYWKIMGKIVDFITLKKIYLGRHVVQHMKWLGLEDQDLKITRPSRRDWPDFVYQAEANAGVSARQGSSS